MADLSDRILNFVSKKNYQPLKAKALARRLGVAHAEYPRFRQTIKELVKQGRLEFGKARTVRMPHPLGTVTGIFRKAAGGYGFVRPHANEASIGEEIFIRADAVGDASTGDEVLVRIRRRFRRPGKGPEGVILRVLERATHQFVGTYRQEGDEGLVVVDGTTFTQPIFVGDPGAKGARPGDKVVFEMIRFPSPFARGEGVITEVLGPHGQPGVDTLSIIRAFELPDEFPPDVLNEARRQAQAFDESDRDGREDFTADPVITIDPPEARDFDDAVCLRYDSRRRHWHLAVHIADVSHFAPPGSLLAREARQRGTSVYLPQRVLPMFPEIISNALASLQQGKNRYVKSALLEFTATGQPVDARFVNGVIRVQRRFTYDEVTGLLESSTRPPHVSPEIFDMLRRMRDFAMILRERRIRRGSLELIIPETELEYDEEGKVIGAHFCRHDISHQIIEEFMLAANEAVARHLADLDVPFLRRIHPPPNPLKLQEFLEFVETLGYDVEVRRPADRFQLQRVLAESAERPEVHAVHYALLRSMKQAEYSPVEEGHYALASDCYCHFTSPIRRYPDLTIHHLLDRWIRTGRVSGDETELVALGEHCSFTERRAEQAERELIKLKLLDYLSHRVGMEMTAIITGVHEYGFYAQAEDFPAEGLVHVSTLFDDYYYYDASTHSLIGRRTKRRLRLGDKVTVQVARVDLQRRELDFRLIRGKKPRRK